MSKGFVGKRYWNLLRSSTKLKKDVLADQKLVNDRFAARLGMVWVNDTVLFGVSGSKTFNRRDLEDLLREKKQNNSYDVLLVHDSSRLTRGGAGHGSQIRREFAKAGVIIMSATDQPPEGEFADVMQTILDTQAHLYAKRLANNVARGLVESIRRGSYEHLGNVPIGIDRLYVRPDGTPFYRLRTVGNRVRHLIDEQTGKLIREYLPGRDDGVIYRKIAGEKVHLVPGDPKVVAAIREAFKLRYMHGWSYHRIGRWLTAQGIKPNRGRLWLACSVSSFLKNPVYLGWSYFLQHECGVYTKGTKDGVLTREFNQVELEGQKILGVPRTKRRVEEMIRVEHSHLTGFLDDPAVRERLEKRISDYYSDYHVKKPANKVNPTHLHTTTSYFLRGIMHDKQYKRYFVAFRGGSRNCPKRYYVLHGRYSFTEKGAIARRGISADAVERPIIELLQNIFGNTERIEAVVRKHVEAALVNPAKFESREALTEELKEIRDRLNFIYQTASKKEREDPKTRELITQLQIRRDHIDDELSLLPIGAIPTEVTKFAPKVMQVLSRFTTGGMSPECYRKLRLVAGCLCRNFEVDLETMEARVDIGVPEHLVRFHDADLDVLCEALSNDHFAIRSAKNLQWVKIASFRMIPPVLTASCKWPDGSCYTWAETGSGQTGVRAA